MEPKHIIKLFGVQINPNIEPNQPSEDFKLIQVQKTEPAEPRKRKRPRLFLFGDLIKAQIKRPKLHKLEPQDLPPRYRDFVLKEGANERSLKLILIKRLEKTDTKSQQERLSLPCKQIRDSFLNPEEEELLKGRAQIGNRVFKNKLDVMVVDPLCEKIRHLKLAKWNDVKVEPGQKKTSWWMALTSKWVDVVEDNGLELGDVIQVWSFRIRDKLGFIIHKIESGSGSGSGSVSGSSTTVDDNWLRCSL